MRIVLIGLIFFTASDTVADPAAPLFKDHVTAADGLGPVHYQSLNNRKLTCFPIISEVAVDQQWTNLRFGNDHNPRILGIRSFGSITSLVVGFEALSDIWRAPQTTRQDQVRLRLVLAEALVTKLN